MTGAPPSMNASSMDEKVLMRVGYENVRPPHRPDLHVADAHCTPSPQ